MLNVILGIALVAFTWGLLRMDATGRLWTPGVIGVFVVLLAFWYFNRNKGQGGPKKK